MKRYGRWLALWCCLLVVPALAAEESVNGYLHEVDGQRVMHVWGTHYEMGYAHGYLIGEDIVTAMHEYILRLLPPRLYELVHGLAPVLFGYPEDYRLEAQGIMDGLRAAGADPLVAPLGREMDVNDLLLCNAVADIGAMACSSQLAWGAATADDPRLAGETAVVRNLDWTIMGPDRFFLPRHTLVAVYSPSESGAQTVASVTFPGYFGCLSCMNEAGLTAVVNIAHNGVPLWEIGINPTFVPVGFTLREALADGAVKGDLTGAVQTIGDSYRSGAIVINLAVPRTGATGDPALVLEIDNQGLAVRRPEDEPEVAGRVLLATNHLRKLRAPTGCRRYVKMRQAVNALDGRLTLAEMWGIEGLVNQDYFLSTTVQTIYFIPARREMGVAFSTADAYSSAKAPVVLTWDDCVALPPWAETDDDDDDATAAPAADDDDDDQGCG